MMNSTWSQPHLGYLKTLALPQQDIFIICKLLSRLDHVPDQWVIKEDILWRKKSKEGIPH